MSSSIAVAGQAAASRAARKAHRVGVDVAPALTGRNRLTTAFRLLLALPHLLLVGGPTALALSVSAAGDRPRLQWGAGTGVLGAVAGVCAMIAWFAILFTGEYPDGLRKLALFYLRWRVRAGAYVMLLRDEYPPFGEGAYPASLRISPPELPRRRASVALRLLLALPHLVVVWALGLLWMVTTVVAWFSILFTGRLPRPLYEFGAGMLQWSTRIEAYLLLLHDDYPPFSLSLRNP
ncbi:MAG TPA: DUF4389 domain-containing protein [Gemmatimonadaceae bacterium]|nr:DUF4389 domain-containing protein [Gemmatimonadaceae bacterium]